MSNDPPKHTLERWAALDAAASPGPWDQEALFSLLRFARKNSGPWDNFGDYPGEGDAELICASREAPTRLIAALRGLAASWRYIPNEGEYEQHAERLQIFACCADELEKIIETLDLAATPQEKQQ